MSSDPIEPPLEVDPSEKPITSPTGGGGKDKDKDKDKDKVKDKGKNAPSGASKGINPVKHSE